METIIEAVLKKADTRQLVKELENRLGVDAVRVDPYEDQTVTVNGPAVILVVTD